MYKTGNVCPQDRLRFRILAPSLREVPRTLAFAAESSGEHAALMYGLQRLRGTAYRDAAPLAAALLPDGRHCQPIDSESWHVLIHDEEQVIGCSRYRKVNGSIEHLSAVHSPIAQSPVTGPLFRSAFQEQFATARRRGMHYGEVGGWAVADDARKSTVAVSIALMTFALAEKLGGGMAITTATTRHRSSAILRRLGGAPLGGFAPYYDPSYDCTMELLQFDVDNLAPRFHPMLDELRAELQGLPITCPVEQQHISAVEPEFLYLPTFIPGQIPAANGVALR